jgi:hypothetical protein
MAARCDIIIDKKNMQVIAACGKVFLNSVYRVADIDKNYK